MEIRINCTCGQHYKFDVEPEGGRMPVPVSCPGCGVDGTAAADAYIQQALAGTQPARVTVAPPAAASRLRVSLGHAAPAAAQPAEATAPAPAEAPAPVAAVAARAPVHPARAAMAQTVVPVPEKQAGGFGMGILGAAIGTLVGVLVWLALFHFTDLKGKGIIKLFAIGVGFAAGLGARVLSKDEGSKDLGYITAAVAFLGIFGTQYHIAYQQLFGFANTLIADVYQMEVDEAKEVVKAIPTGTDAEIRVYLAKQESFGDQKVVPAAIDAGDVQDFKTNDLPRYRRLASGGITREQYTKEIKRDAKIDEAEDKLKKNDGIKLFLAIRGLGSAGLIGLAVALGAAYKMAATDA